MAGLEYRAKATCIRRLMEDGSYVDGLISAEEHNHFAKSADIFAESYKIKRENIVKYNPAKPMSEAINKVKLIIENDTSKN